MKRVIIISKTSDTDCRYGPKITNTCVRDGVTHWLFQRRAPGGVWIALNRLVIIPREAEASKI